MSWQQVKPFDPAKGGTTVGLCLTNVRKGHEIASKYSTAYEAWQHTKQHPDKNFPEGVSVPVFWEYMYEGEPAGHVAERLPNGKVWTDGRYYNSVDELNAQYLYGKGKYLGWGETLNDVTVVKEVPVEQINKGDIDNMWDWMYGKKPTQADYDAWVGKTFKEWSYGKAQPQFYSLREQLKTEYVPVGQLFMQKVKK